jgi:hypothetical protein
MWKNGTCHNKLDMLSVGLLIALESSFYIHSANHRCPSSFAFPLSLSLFLWFLSLLLTFSSRFDLLAICISLFDAFLSFLSFLLSFFISSCISLIYFWFVYSVTRLFQILRLHYNSSRCLLLFSFLIRFLSSDLFCL